MLGRGVSSCNFIEKHNTPTLKERLSLNKYLSLNIRIFFRIRVKTLKNTSRLTFEFFNFFSRNLRRWSFSLLASKFHSIARKLKGLKCRIISNCRRCGDTRYVIITFWLMQKKIQPVGTGAEGFILECHSIRVLT